MGRGGGPLCRQLPHSFSLTACWASLVHENHDSTAGRPPRDLSQREVLPGMAAPTMGWKWQWTLVQVAFLNQPVA